MTRPATRHWTQNGFTLIELLIVIAIIGILASLALVGVSIVRDQTNAAMTQQTIGALLAAIENYELDEGVLPSSDRRSDPDRNDFPRLWSALVDDPPEGGRHAPYLNIPRDDVAVRDGDDYRPVTRSEFFDSSIDKSVLDPWGNPYVYRSNRNRKRAGWMIHPRRFDLYSRGANQEDGHRSLGRGRGERRHLELTERCSRSNYSSQRRE